MKPMWCAKCWRWGRERDARTPRPHEDAATPTGPFVVVRDFNLTVAEGEFVCLVGHSGCGKSTVLSIAAGLNMPGGGRVMVAGRPIDGPDIDRGVVFQSPSLLPWMSALDNVRLAVDQARPAASREEREAIARDVSRVGLASAVHRKPAELSQACSSVSASRGRSR